MELTRELAIAEHRKMWNWIADKIKEERKVLDIHALKRRFCNRVEFGYVALNCFLCDYAKEDCERCPLKWESEASSYMCERYNDPDEFSEDSEGLWLKCCDSEDWEEQAALARQIANLPERTDV